MANIDTNFNGLTKLRDWWDKVKQNIININNQLVNHISGLADKHSAQHVTYSGNATGSNVKEALDNTDIRIDNLAITGTDHDPLVTDSLVDVENEDFGPGGTGTYLNGRLDKWETKVNEHLAENVQQFSEIDADILALQTDKADKTEVNDLATNKADKTEINSLATNKVGGGVLAAIADMSQEVKSAWTGGSVAIVGTQSVNMVQFVPIIQKDIGTWGVVSTAAVDDYYGYSINGSNVAFIHNPSGSGNGHSILNVNAGEVYKITIDVPPSASLWGLIYTDNSLNVISSFLQGTASVVRYSDLETSVPQGATKMLLSWRVGGGYYHIVNKLTYSPIATKTEVTAQSNRLDAHTFEVPSFYSSHIDSKINTIHALENAYGSDGETIAFITDMHYPDNPMYSINLLRKLVETTNLKAVINGGDNLRDNSSISVAKDRSYTFNKIIKQALGDRFVRLYGNHDNNSNQATTMTAEEVYSIIGKPQENVIKMDSNKLNGMYWYVDNPTQKIRYIGLNLFEGTEGVISVDQMKWLCETALVLPSTGWYVAFFTHRPTSPLKTSLMSEFRQILNAIRYKSNYSAVYTDYNNNTYNISVDFYPYNASVLFVACGHIHYDTLDIDNGIGYFSSICDASYKDDASVPVRTAGTTDSQSFDVITINKKTNTINLTKIGAGSDRNFTFINNR